MQGSGEVPSPVGDFVPKPGQATAPEAAPAKPSDPKAPPPDLDALGEEKGFFQRLLDARATTAFLLAVLLIFGLMWKDPGTVTLRGNLSPSVYVKYGGFSLELVRAGEWWRFLSAMFVSRSAMGAFVYLFIFFQMGPSLERLLGTVRFSVLYMGAGVAGIALACIIDPKAWTFGTILVIYALLGGIPGTIWGYTGSFGRMLVDPSSRSSLVYLLFWIGLAAFSGQVGSVAAGVGAGIMGFWLGVTLGGWRRSPGRAALLTIFPLLVVLTSAGLVMQGYRWLDGGLVQLRAGGRGGTSTDPDVPDPIPDDVREDRGQSQAEELRERVGEGLDAYGPLASLPGEEMGDADIERVQAWLQELNEKVLEDNDVLGQLDDLRVRCLMLLGRHHEAAGLAEQYMGLQPSAEARALAGVALHFKAGQSSSDAAEQAETYLESALQEQGLEVRMPEARYYLGVLLYLRRADAESTEQFERFLEIVGEDDDEQPRYRRALVRQAKTQLDR